MSQLSDKLLPIESLNDLWISVSDLAEIRGFLFDLDGVFYIGKLPIEGAKEALSDLRSQGYLSRFITNTSTLSVASLQAKLVALGFDVARSEIFSAPQAAVTYLKCKGQPRCHLVLAEDVRQDFRLFRQVEERAEVVVVGDIGERWNYSVLNQAFRHLFEGAELLAMHKNRFWQTETGLKMDLGGFVAALEYASAKTARVMGKPSTDFFNLALLHMGLPASEVAIVGDDIESDIAGGHRAGLTTILVQTGKYREEFVRAAGIQPDYVIGSIRDLPTLLGIRE